MIFKKRVKYVQELQKIELNEKGTFLALADDKIILGNSNSTYNKQEQNEIYNHEIDYRKYHHKTV